jgi:hypothetical protein
MGFQIQLSVFLMGLFLDKMEGDSFTMMPSLLQPSQRGPPMLLKMGRSGEKQPAFCLPNAHQHGLSLADLCFRLLVYKG